MAKVNSKKEANKKADEVKVYAVGSDEIEALVKDFADKSQEKYTREQAIDFLYQHIPPALKVGVSAENTLTGIKEVHIRNVLNSYMQREDGAEALRALFEGNNQLKEANKAAREANKEAARLRNENKETKSNKVKIEDTLSMLLPEEDMADLAALAEQEVRVKQARSQTARISKIYTDTVPVSELVAQTKKGVINKTIVANQIPKKLQEAIFNGTAGIICGDLDRRYDSKTKEMSGKLIAEGHSNEAMFAMLKDICEKSMHGEETVDLVPKKNSRAKAGIEVTYLEGGATKTMQLMKKGKDLAQALALEFCAVIPQSKDFPGVTAQSVSVTDKKTNSVTPKLTTKWVGQKDTLYKDKELILSKFTPIKEAKRLEAGEAKKPVMIPSNIVVYYYDGADNDKLLSNGQARPIIKKFTLMAQVERIAKPVYMPIYADKVKKSKTAKSEEVKTAEMANAVKTVYATIFASQESDNQASAAKTTLMARLEKARVASALEAHEQETASRREAAETAAGILDSIGM